MYLFANDLSDPVTLKLFQSVGLYLIDNRKADPKLTNSDINKIKIAEKTLQLNKIIHSQLKKIARKGNGKLLNEGAVAKLLANGNLLFTTEHRLQQKKKAQIEFETSGVLSYSTSSTIEGEDVIELTNDEIQVLIDFLKSINNDVKGVFSIIEFNIRKLRNKIPSYINQLRSGIVSFDVKNVDDVLKGYDAVSSMIFKRQMLIASEDAIGIVRANRDISPINTCMIKANNNINVSYLINRGFVVEKPRATKIVLRHEDSALIIYANIGAELLYEFVGLKFQKIMTAIGEVAVGYSNSDILGTGHFTISALYPTNIIDAPRDIAIVFIKRLMHELRNKLRKVVTVVVHAPKGKGKSYLSRRLLPMFERFSGRMCYVIDSDNYGRMRHQIHTYEAMMAMTLTDVLAYNKAGLKSWYNERAKEILLDNDMTMLQQYLRASKRLKSKIFSEIDEMMNPEILSGLGKLNEESYYSHIYGMIPDNSCLIIESHTVSRDAILGPSNLTMIYESCIDPYVILRQRDINEELIQFVMHDYYLLQIGRVHTTVNLWEFDAMFV